MGKPSTVLADRCPRMCTFLTIMIALGCAGWVGSAFSADPQYAWARSFGGTNADDGFGVVTNAAGHVIVVGRFRDTVDFDPTAGIDEHTANGNWDVFVTRLDEDGSYLETLTIGGISQDQANAVSLDPLEGPVMAGSFAEIVDFDPTAGEDIRSSNGGADIFVTKLNGDGSYAWTYTAGGAGPDRAFGVATDAGGSVYAVGVFEFTVDFDPTPTEDLHTSNGSQDIFVTKLAADGTYQWTRTVGGNYGDDGLALAVDPSGNLIATGNFVGTVDFDPGPGTDQRTSHSGSEDLFVTRLLSDGTYDWTVTLGGSNSDEGLAVALRNDDSAVVTGRFRNTVDFDPGPGTDNHSSNGNSDVFLLGLAADGSYLWARTFGGGEVDVGRAVAIDVDNDVWVGGDFRGTIDFDPQSGEDYRSAVGGGDLFLAHYDAAVTYAGGYTAGGSANDRVYGLATDAAGGVNVTGQFLSTVDFDPAGPGDVHSSNGDTDVFVLKLQGEVPEPTGACCIADDCQELTEAQCQDAGGIFLGTETLCTPGLCPPQPPDEIAFSDPLTYGLGGSSSPLALDTCDLNNDGWADVVVVQNSFDRVAMLYNDGVGFGSLDPPLVWTVGEDPIAVACADIDADGNNDVVTADFGGASLSVLLNDGDGRFTHQLLPLGSAAGPRDVIACDLDDDDVLDLVSVNYQPGLDDTFTVFMGLGGGDFEPPLTSAVGGASPQSIRCADLNGDGVMDLASANEGTDDVSILLGSGNGSFEAPAVVAAAAGPEVLASCDVDGDLDEDLLVNASSGDTVTLLRNNGDGSFAPFETLGAIDDPEGLICLDADRDGDADVLGGAGVDQAFALLNTGVGEFFPPQFFTIEAEDPRRAAACFLNDDCLPDLLLVASVSGELAVLMNGGNSVDFEEPDDYDAGHSTVKIIHADLDGDGWEDLITADLQEPATFSLFFNNQDGTFAPATQIDVQCVKVFTVTASDLDGDGDQDLAGACQNPHGVVVFRNQGDGSFAHRTEYLLPVSVFQEIVACDVDGDADADLVVAEDGDQIFVLPNQGDGTFGSFYEDQADAGSQIADLVCGDLNQDGSADLAICNPGGSLHLHFNDGAGDFALGFVSTVGNSAAMLVSCDVDGDFMPDLAVADDDGVSILQNLGGGSFGEATSTGDGPHERLQCCDVDADGDPDLVVDAPSSHITVLQNNGSGVFQWFPAFFSMGGVGDLTCTDLSGEGVPDAATASFDGTIAVRRNALAPLFDYVDQPLSQTVPACGAAIFSVSLNTDDPLVYQWFRGADALPGMDSATLVIEAAGPQDAGDYRVLAMGDCFGLFSHTATLVVDAPPADLNGDSGVDAADLALLLGAWGANPGHAADFNADGVVNAADLALLLGGWGSCP